MKREGRQHGMVQTYPIISSPWTLPRRTNRLQSPSTAGTFTKVLQKPTNHSKFTGKCGRPRCASCHVHPACKAKDKTKGTQKLKSCDVVTNYRLVTWRVVDARPGFNFSGFSATGVLDHLANDYCNSDDGDTEIDDVCDYNEVGAYGLAPPNNNNHPGIEEKVDHDDEKMSFCDVGFAWEQVEGDDDQGRCLVEEI
ncbi:hypothetical protein ACH5RR_014506 [Cinchona calisaya]|uniref:Uncharacterized protein n=1 Tax=Cinchona calisaya TaxID=153742 RepID=A0ABD3A361_9GENT